MIYVATILLSLLQGTLFWVSWFGSQNPWVISFFGERLGVVLMALALGGLLTLLGHKRRDYFLALGNGHAKAEGMSLPWSIAGPMIALVLAALSVAAVLSMMPLSSVSLAVVVPLLPAVFLFALLNAFGEELAYRATLLSQLWGTVGKRHAIWMTALWFGLGHYYGGISFGAIGAIYITLTAVIFGKAMLETKGLAVPVFMHMMIDAVIYIALALGSA
jgi:membrane protease YdiL (CAAX protease family)